ncbi:MAG: lipid-A-disaccharide synthase [Candidatus Omnitrophota bacterium]
MIKENLKLMMLAGEESGDLHGASLIQALRKQSPRLEIFGAGGPRMKEAGIQLEVDLVQKAVVGFTQVLRHLGEFRKIFAGLLKRCREEKPDAVILIDYPGFNLRFARAAKKLGFRVVYYISPQLWAWGEWRIKTIRQAVDQMIVVFPFEEAFYKQYGVTAQCVGHPLLDLVALRDAGEKESLRRNLGIPKEKTIVGLLPGSRKKEVSDLFPVMLQAGCLLQKTLPNLHFLVFQSSTLPEALYKKCKTEELSLQIVQDADYRYRNLMDFALVASGTATLENAILGKPMVILYKVSFLNYLLLRNLIQLPYVGLVNVVFGEKRVPECLQFEATPKRVAEEALRFLKDPDKMARMGQELLAVRGKLGQHGASSRAAEAILNGLRQGNFPA